MKNTKRISKTILLFTMAIASACGSDSVDDPPNCDTEGVSLETVSIEGTQCDEANGRVEVAATGATGEYTFTINDGDEQTSPVFEGLSAGAYIVTVTDQNTCSTSINVSVANVDGVNMEITSNAAGCGASEGAIIAEAVGGDAPYQFKLNGGTYQDEHEFLNLSRGEYTVTVRDATGCEVQSTVNVPSGVSFSATIQPIIANNCAVNTCHNGNQFPDFRQFSNIQANATNIKRLTGNRTMPKQGSLTQDQIDAIACWVDDGALNN